MHPHHQQWSLHLLARQQALLLLLGPLQLLQVQAEA